MQTHNVALARSPENDEKQVEHGYAGPLMRRPRTIMEPARHGMRAGLVAAVVSGAPSTLHAVATGRDPLAAATAAGSMLVGGDSSRTLQVAAAVPVHLILSIGWGIALAVGLPRRHEAAWGAAAGVGIAALDLGVIGRRIPAIAALPTGPQIADHAAFGALAGAVIGRLRSKSPRRANGVCASAQRNRPRGR